MPRRSIATPNATDSAKAVITADADKIRSGQAEDISLLPFDIVDVPQKGREKRKFPPVVRVDYAGGPNSTSKGSVSGSATPVYEAGVVRTSHDAYDSLPGHTPMVSVPTVLTAS